MSPVKVLRQAPDCYVPAGRFLILVNLESPVTFWVCHRLDDSRLHWLTILAGQVVTEDLNRRIYVLSRESAGTSAPWLAREDPAELGIELS